MNLDNNLNIGRTKDDRTNWEKNNCKIIQIFACPSCYLFTHLSHNQPRHQPKSRQPIISFRMKPIFSFRLV